MSTKDKLAMYAKTVLLVDDVALFIEMAREFFRREQVHILTAKSGPEAVAIIRSSKPDIVFMDLYMSGGDGDAACREIKRDSQLKSIPIIILTSSTLPQDLERCRQAGCDDYVKKPMTREQGLDIVKKYLQVPEWSGKRVRADILVKFGAGPDRPSAGAINDVSIGGIFLGTEELLPVDTQIHLEFLLDRNWPPIKCKGRVAWHNTRLNRKKSHLSTGMGIQFTEIAYKDVLQIQEWLSRES